MEENNLLITENKTLPNDKIINNELLEQKNQNKINSKQKLFFSFTENSLNNKFCQICQKKFSTNVNLRNHILTIHKNIRPYVCPFPGCQKTYTIQSRLQFHFKSHSGKKQYICTYCSKAFNEKGNLKTHEKFHSEKRPFKCNQCNKSYKTNGHLKDHIQIHHLKIKKYKCEICEKKFGRISTLKSHNKIHTGEKNYKCQIEGCNKCFAEKGNMEIHFKRHLNKLNGKSVKSNVNENENMTRPSSNSTLYSIQNNNKGKVLNYLNKDLPIQNSINSKDNIICNNDINSNVIYKNNDNVKNNNCKNFINVNEGNNNCSSRLINNSNEKNDINFLDFPQDINFESEKVFEVNLEN